jgi:hypothetical protein
MNVRSRNDEPYPAFSEITEEFALPNTARVAGSSAPLGTIHQQPHARQRNQSALGE